MAKSKIELILDMKDRMTTSLKRAKEAVASNTEVMNSDIMGALGIEQMYFENIEDLKVLETYHDTVAFKFKAYSIKPVEFLFKNQQKNLLILL